MSSLVKSYSIQRRIEIDAAHRVPLHGSKCANIHGHRYVVEALCRGPELFEASEQQGMLLDFSFLKEEMMNEIHNFCDHACILSLEDPLLAHLFSPEVLDTISTSVDEFGSALIAKEYWKVYVISGPPTAEVLAEHWFRRLKDRVDLRSRSKAELTSIRVHETPNCIAIFQPSAPRVSRLVTADELVHAEDLGLVATYGDQ